MPNTALGGTTRTFILQQEAHKTTVEFVAAATILKGQPVKLNATGGIVAWVKADLQHLCIGYASNSGDNGDYITVWTRGYMILNALSHAALSCGPAVYESVVTSGDDTGYTKWDDGADATNIGGWIMDDATDENQLIRVLVKN